MNRGPSPATCPTCGQPMPSGRGAAPLSSAELDALSAWWHTGSIRAAADLLSRSQRTVINHLYAARIRNNVHATVELLPLYLGRLRTMSELLTQHNQRGKEAA